MLSPNQRYILKHVELYKVCLL